MVLVCLFRSISHGFNLSVSILTEDIYISPWNVFTPDPLCPCMEVTHAYCPLSPYAVAGMPTAASYPEGENYNRFLRTPCMQTTLMCSFENLVYNNSVCSVPFHSFCYASGKERGRTIFSSSKIL